jgi:hypothetical protein
MIPLYYWWRGYEEEPTEERPELVILSRVRFLPIKPRERGFGIIPQRRSYYFRVLE